MKKLIVFLLVVFGHASHGAVIYSINNNSPTRILSLSEETGFSTAQVLSHPLSSQSGRGISYDPVNDTLYWGYGLYRVPRGGGSIETIISPTGAYSFYSRYSPATREIFFTSASGGISAFDPKTNVVRPIISSSAVVGPNGVNGFDVDRTNGDVFFSLTTEHTVKILRHANGHSPDTLGEVLFEFTRVVGGQTLDIIDVAFDDIGRELFWTEESGLGGCRSTRALRAAKLGGTPVDLPVNFGCGVARRISVHDEGRSIYWAVPNDPDGTSPGGLYRADLDGNNVMKLFTSGDDLMGIDFGSELAGSILSPSIGVPEPRAWHILLMTIFVMLAVRLYAQDSKRSFVTAGA